jgi:hypothetical protein
MSGEGNTSRNRNKKNKGKRRDESPSPISSDASSGSRKTKTSGKNVMSNIEELYKNDILSQEEFIGIMQKMKDKDNIKDWCSEYVCILSAICEKSQCYRYMHENSNSYYKNLSYRITYASMFFSGLMSCFSIVSTKLEDVIPANLAALISGLGHLIIAGVTGFQKKMNLPESAEMHEKASQDFDIFCRNIEFQLILPIEDRVPVPKFVFESIDKYENLVISNPQIPHRILNYFRHSVEKLSINKPSIVNSFTMMPKSLDDNIIDNTDHAKHIWTPCQRDSQLRKIQSKAKKKMPELSPTIKKMNARQVHKTIQRQITYNDDNDDNDYNDDNDDNDDDSGYDDSYNEDFEDNSNLEKDDTTSIVPFELDLSMDDNKLNHKSGDIENPVNPVNNLNNEKIEVQIVRRP